MSPYLDRFGERVGGHTIVDSGLLGLMLLRAGWFVYAALDLEYSPGVLPHGMVRITLLEQYVTGRVYQTYCRSPRLENKAASKKEKYEKIMEKKMSTPIVSLYKDTALPTGHTSY